MLNQRSEDLFSMADEEARARIVALGIGGMGRNAMENIAVSDVDGLELYSLNTDLQDLAKCAGSKPVQIGRKKTAGKGAGGDFEVGRLSAEEDIEKIRGLIEGADLVFIAAGMGGGTGTGAAPVVARLCREMEIISIAIVTTPMICEGSRRMEKAQAGLKDLRNSVDSLMVIENEKLSLLMDKDDISIINVFKRADQVLLNGINGIGRVINNHGYINLDMADLENVLQKKDGETNREAFIGVGISAGDDRALRAAANALHNPLLEFPAIKGATRILINVIADENIGLSETRNAVQAIVDEAGTGDPEVYLGFTTDNSMGDKISVTIIATGMGNGKVAGPTLVVKKPVINDNEILVASRVETATINLGATFENERPGVAEERANFRDDNFCPVSIEDFGTTPFVKLPDWQTPAYMRRESRYSDRDICEKKEIAAGNAVRDEFATLKRFKRKTRRSYNSTLLRLAC